jgi:hypothetical protein
MFCLVPKHKANNQNKPNVLFGTQAQSKKPKEAKRKAKNQRSLLVAKRKAKNQRKERLRPLLFPEENPFVRPSVRAGCAIENGSQWSVIGRAGSAVKNASTTPNH